jgi:hypothetical protein
MFGVGLLLRKEGDNKYDEASPTKTTRLVADAAIRLIDSD